MSLLDTASLIVTPNGYKEGKLYSVIPSDGSGDLSVTRATTATRVNSAGLVELVPYNLFSWSEDFSNAYWNKFNFATITSNATTAPNGTLTADLLISGTSQAMYSTGTTKATESLFYTFTCYVKYYNTNVFRAEISDFTTSTTYILFNFTTQATTITEGGTWSNTTASMTDVGNGWFKCTITSKTPASSSLYFVATTTGADAVGGVYIWGAQLVEGSTAKDYQKTETRLNIPRLDYSNGTCPSLLVEPQRTNIALYSEDIAQSLPTNGGGTITANNTTAPNGVTSADRFLVDTSTGAHYFYNDYTAVNGQAYTTSIFLKAGTGRYFLYRVLTNLNADRFGATIDLLTGTILSTDSLGTPTGTSAKIEDYGNGWYRVSLTINGEGTLLSTILETSNTGTPTLDPFLDYYYTGNGTDTYYLWGNQIEAGSYTTSYIPTTSASVTRNADRINKTGISSLIGQTEGTIFLDFYYDLTNNTLPSSARFQLSDGSTNKWILVSTPDAGTQQARFYLNNNGNDVSLFSATNLIAGRNKVAVGYKSGQYVLYLNGVLSNSSTSSVVVPATSRLDFSGNVPDDPTVVKSNFNAAAIWKTRLTNDQLATLTTL